MTIRHEKKIEFLQIEPTTRCNFTCGFCCGRKMSQQNIDLESFEKAISLLPDLKHIELQGEGEPLLHPNFFTMAQRAREKGIKLSIITNGSLLAKGDTISRLLNFGFEKVSVSIETSDSSEFKRIRGGKLESVIAGLKELIAERTRRGLTRPVVGFAVTVLESTVDSYPSIISLYKQLGMDGGITTQLLQRMETYVKSYSESMLQELVTDESAIRFEQHRMSGRVIIGSTVKVGFYRELYDATDQTSNVCPWLEKGIFINLNGEMSSCPKIKDSKTYGYGNISTTSIDQTYAVRNKMRDQLRCGEVPTACTGCPEAERYRGRPDVTGQPLGE